MAQWIEQRFPKPLVAGSIPAGGAFRNKDLADPLVPPVIKNGLVPREDGASVVAASAREIAVEVGEERRVVVDERGKSPAHRVQLARALADAVVGAIEAGDVEGARVALGMLERVVGLLDIKA